MKFPPRLYQIETYELTKKAGELPIVCIPTGGGKTVVICMFAESAIKKGNRVHVVCHRAELIEQARKTMKAYGIPMQHVKFGMVQTYVRSPHKIPEAELTIIDEVHYGSFRRFVELVKDRTYIIGATATPISANKKEPLNKTFKSVVCPVQIPELIEAGYLSKPIYHIAGLDLSGLELASNGDYSEASQNEAFSNLFSLDTLRATMRQIGNEKTIIFTPSVEMAEKVAGMVRPCYIAHSKMTTAERDRAVEGFIADPAGIIVNCSILTAGFDDPAIRHVVLYRATTSEPLYLQMVGRGSRVTPGVGGDVFHVWDLGQNYKRIAYWHMERDWVAKFNEQGKKTKKGESPYKNCISCEALIFASARTCAVCGEAQPAPKAKPLDESTEFAVIEYGKNIPTELQKGLNEMTVKELIQRAQYGSQATGRPFKMGWIINQIKYRKDAKELIFELARIKGYKKSWAFMQLNKIG
jgi:superfamily II DNA or RNA helicase